MKGNKKLAIQDWEKAVQIEPNIVDMKILDELKLGHSILEVTEFIELKTLNYHVK